MTYKEYKEWEGSKREPIIVDQFWPVLYDKWMRVLIFPKEQRIVPIEDVLNETR